MLRLPSESFLNKIYIANEFIKERMAKHWPVWITAGKLGFQYNDGQLVSVKDVTEITLRNGYRNSREFFRCLRDVKDEITNLETLILLDFELRNEQEVCEGE